MAKTTKKEMVLDLKKISDTSFLDKLRKKINFVDVTIRMKKLGQVSIILAGSRERVNYAISLVKNFIQENKIED
ncbi:MAG: hypothetical protein ACTSVY_08240 [Candidatus Helarchaeota archaeon]